MAAAAASAWQVAEQPSPLAAFPSSQASPASTTPLPQIRLQTILASSSKPIT
jgi:hypothetical protein